MTRLKVPEPVARDDLGEFVARVVRLDRAAAVRVRAAGPRLVVWASTPFDVLVTHSVEGAVEPADRTVAAADLLTALTVERADAVDLGTEGAAGPRWSVELPPDHGWWPVGAVPVAELAELAERGLAEARQDDDPHGPPAALLDRTALTLDAAAGSTGEAAASVVRVPLRCLVALSGMGLLDEPDGSVRVSATGSWLRLDTGQGAVVRRRLTALPLLVR